MVVAKRQGREKPAKTEQRKVSCQRHVRPIFEMKWRPRAFSRVSTGDSDILSSCDMKDEQA